MIILKPITVIRPILESMKKCRFIAFLARHKTRSIRINECGATTTEYALILALVVIVLISSLTALGNALQDKLSDIITQIKTAS